MIDLSETEIHALNEALDDEYRAFAAYDQVLADFGEAPPFSNIRDAEGRLIDTLCAQGSATGRHGRGAGKHRGRKGQL